MKSNPRPRIITWLALGMFLFSMLFVLRLTWSYRLPDVPILAPQWYFSLTGLFWALAGLILSYGLFRTRPWALRMLLWGSLFFAGWYWSDRLLLVRSEYSRVNWPASAMLTILALGLLLWIQRRADVRAAFQENQK